MNIFSTKMTTTELLQVLGDSQDEVIIWQTAEALQYIPGEAVTEGLLAFLDPTADEMRCRAVAQAFWNREGQFRLHTPGYRSDPRIEAALIAVLEDENRSVYTRDRAAEALGSAAPRSSERTLLALCEASRHPSVWIRMGALCALSLWMGEDEEGNPSDPRAVQAFRDRKDDHETAPGYQESVYEYFRHHIDGLD